ncbi:MAG: hypothetical protein IPN86_22075 [Saprospiraceae bacterium]|nr:hypothetical protein [Saprospiraceae bacterium]
MTIEIILDNNKYVILPKERYDSLLKKHVYEKYNGELLSVEQAKARSLKRLEKWMKPK